MGGSVEGGDGGGGRVGPYGRVLRTTLGGMCLQGGGGGVLWGGGSGGREGCR